MHELAITQSIVESVAERLPDAQVVRVRLVIGKLSGVSVPSLRFCFGPVTEGTGLEGAELLIDEPGGRLRCRGCENEFAGDDLLAICACGGLELEVVAGRELLIRSVEVRDRV